MQKTIRDLFIDELHDILSAEKQIIKALPKVVTAAESKELKDAYQKHLKETKEQVIRLQKVFKILKLAPKEKFCKATKGLIEECSEVITEYSKSFVRDAALISKTQRIEHYEISAYGTLCTFAKELGHKDIARILHETLEEEEHADKTLTKLAAGGFLTSGINHKANLGEIELPEPTKKTGIISKIKKAITSKEKAVKKAITPKKATVKKVTTKATKAKNAVVKSAAKAKKVAVNSVKKGVSKVKRTVSSSR